METKYKAVADLMAASHTFLVTSHIDPDGDAIGCSLAIYSILTRLGKTVKVVYEEPVPATFSFLKGSREVITSETASCRTDPFLHDVPSKGAPMEHDSGRGPHVLGALTLGRTHSRGTPASQ